MKKAFNISLLGHFLIKLGLFCLLLLYFHVDNANSSSLKSKDSITPIKRPLDLFDLEESADTISNLVQKVGAKPTGRIKKTKLKQNENLSSALRRINFANYDIYKIIDSINSLKDGTKILSSLPIDMIIN